MKPELEKLFFKESALATLFLTPGPRGITSILQSLTNFLLVSVEGYPGTVRLVVP